MAIGFAIGKKPPAKKQVFATKSAAWPKQQTVLTFSYQIPQTANGILSRFAISAIASSVRNSQLQDLWSAYQTRQTFCLNLFKSALVVLTTEAVS